MEPRYTNDECDADAEGVTMAELRALNADDPPDDLYEMLGALAPGESVSYDNGAGGISVWTRTV